MTRETRFTKGFDQILQAAGIDAIKLPPGRKKLNVHAELVPQKRVLGTSDSFC
jgi:hypothetical protein